MVMCIQRKIFVMDWKIPPSSLKQNAIPAPRGFAPRVWNLHFAFVIRVEFFNPSLKFSLDSLNSKCNLPLIYKYIFFSFSVEKLQERTESEKHIQISKKMPRMCTNR